MSDVEIRRAQAEDEATIKQMVKEEQLDPTSLKWQQFMIAEKDGEVVGIGQVRLYSRCHELGSLAVKKEYREQGVGGMLIKALLENESGDVHLECLPHNINYYGKFGFKRIPWWRAPMPLILKIVLVNVVFRSPTLAMKRIKS